VARNETAALSYLIRAARKGSPIAQNRLAYMYATGRGVKADPVQAGRWHLIAKAGGDNDQFLEDFLRKMTPADRAAAEAAARPWLALLGPTTTASTAPAPTALSPTSSSPFPPPPWPARP
jgi:TPR repeat protein